MSVRTSVIKTIFILFTICSLVLVTFVPIIGADTTMLTQPGFSKGVTWKPYIAMKKTTFVGYDTESYLDDYAYLAAVPTTVFYDDVHYNENGARKTAEAIAQYILTNSEVTSENKLIYKNTSDKTL